MGPLTLVAQMMEIAARTAPKARGQDFVVTRIIEGEELRPLVDKMAEIAEREERKIFARDSRNVAASDVVLLIGMKDAQKAGLNCGACGVPTCADLNVDSHSGQFAGPQCAFRVLDLGIAIGSAAKTAGLFNADNRIMYTIGAAARELGLIDADFVMGIPLSATGKSIYYDRPPVT